MWLTREQGGRVSGPSRTSVDQDSATPGYVPPATAETGLASVVLRAEDRAAWRSAADAGWLVVDSDGPYLVREGDVIVIT